MWTNRVRGVAAGMSVVWILMGLAGVRAQAPQASATSYAIADIQVTGNRRYTRDQVVKVSGLSSGQRVTVSDVDATMTRMASTGLFAKVGYRYDKGQAADAGLIITFEIEEPAWTMPVVFDNFVWFSDAEIQRAVAVDVPSFDGTLPITDGIQALMTRSLEAMLKTHGHPHAVTFSLHSNPQTKVTRYLFTVANEVRVCAITLPGASAEWITRLMASTRTLVGVPYSRAFLDEFARASVRDAYQARGYAAVEVGPPALAVDRGCQGVSVSLPIAEGEEYTWSEPRWRGVAALPLGDLNRLLGVRTGSVADRSTLEQNLALIRNAYGKVGHMQVRITSAVQPDAATRRATLDLRVDEGPQFRMGIVEFVGLAPADGASLGKRWALKEGAVYDATYAARFVREQVAPFARGRRLGVRGPILASAPNRPVVNVRFEFRAAQ